MMECLLIAVTCVSGFLVVYHHAGYPLLLKQLARNRQEHQPQPLQRGYMSQPEDAQLPHIHLIVPAYNEARWIQHKIRNINLLDYPASRLTITIACDGCTDNTAELAQQEAAQYPQMPIEICNFQQNRGKVAVLNEVVGSSQADIIALSDVSAITPIDALLLAAAQFQTPRIGVVNSHYQLLEPGSSGESAYWDYQSAIKTRESRLGATMGAHGAFYLFRRNSFTPLPSDTINDDFILPMNVVLKGYQAIQDNRILSLELEKSDDSMDFNRRLRISSGNTQQLIRLLPLLNPRFGYTTFNFLSGKALRVIMPWLMLLALIGSLLLAPMYPVFMALAVAQLFGYTLALLPIINPGWQNQRLIKSLNYLVVGHCAGLIGSWRYLTGKTGKRWQRVSETQEPSRGKPPMDANTLEERTLESTFTIDPVTARAKRTFDVVFSLIGLILTLPLFPLIALAIRLESSGPIFFRQLRIGKSFPDRVLLFEMIKFRTMVQNAEKGTGATWAKKQDARITRVGNFLRKTRLDELPQFINVLVGDMSIIGPRPERPGFYHKLEAAIPFFAERTYGVPPGITGLAQVNQGYDTCIEDVRSKVGFDHTYGLALSSLSSWLKMDLYIMFKTVEVMVMGRGQ
jgi:lipopolysaccharide/colanic/teichoic acid biosynthesis glycosyltransferase/cellulose synthase/poly-beta-1,6-N-acetylglucosamine synthase-like glycosyltransferase